MQKAARTAKAVASSIYRVGHLVPMLLLVGILIGVVITVGAEIRKPYVAKAAVNSTINFQARVTNSSGSVIPDGNVTVQFKLYDAPSGGNNPWTETQTIPAKNGYITVSLGSVTPFPATIDWSQEQWITLNVNSDGEMGPTRMKVTGVPYSFRSGQADALTNGSGSITAAGLAQLSPGSIQSINSANSTLRINQQGSGGLLQLQGDGLDVFTVSKAGDVVAVGGMTLGNSSSSAAGTIRWSGTDFQGYNGTDWVSLTAGSQGVLSGTNATFTSGLANVAANATGSPAEVMILTSGTAVSFTAGVTEFKAPSDGSFRTCHAQNTAAISGGTLAVRWRVNGVSVGSSVCNMNTTNSQDVSSVVNSGTVNFAAGDTIGVAFDTVNLAPTNNDFTVYWSVEYTSGAAGGTTLQDAYNNSSTPALISTSNGKDLSVVLENTATDSNFLVNIASGSTGRFAVQNNGTDTLTVDASGTDIDNLTVTNGLTLSSGDLTITNGALIVESGGASFTGGIDINGDGIVNAGNITGVGTDLTASGALVVSSGATNDLTLNSGSGTLVLGASTLSRTSAGTTTIDLIDSSDTIFAINNSGAGLANLSAEGIISAGSFNGDGSGLTDLDASNISSGTIDDSYLSGNVGLLNLSQTYNARPNFSAGLTLGNTANATAGNLRWTGADFEGYNGLEWLSLTSGSGGPGNGSTNVVTVIKPSNETVNNSASLQDDNHLKFPIAASENWTFRFVLKANSGSTPNLKFAITAPGGASCSIDVIDAEGAVTASNLGCGVSSGTIAGNGVTDTYEIIGSIINGSTAGDVTLQWSQDTADNSDTIIYSGSYVNAIPASDITGTTSNAFVQGGNAFGAAAIIGTTDENELRLVTNGIRALTIDSTGDSTFTGLLTVDDGVIVTAGGIDLSSSGIVEAGNITGVGSDITASGGLTISTTGSNNLTLSTNGLIVLGSNSLSRTAIGTTSLDLVDSSDTVFAITNSGGGNANLSVDGTISIGTAPTSNKLSINTPNTADTNAQAIIYTNGINNKGLVIQSVSGQTTNNFEVQNNGGQVLAGFDKSGQLVLGNDATSAQAGLITFNDSTGSNNYTSVLGTSTLNNNRSINLPNEDGTLCVQGSPNCGFIILGPGSAQIDSATNSSVFINKTGVSGNIITLQKNGANVFEVLNNGALHIMSTDASAFTVSNNDGTNQYFDVDTSAGIIQIGGAASDDTGIILVLDVKNTNGDPGGQEGALYYNSARGRFRCYENARGWTDCLGIAKPNTRRSTQAMPNGTANTFTVLGDNFTNAGTGTATASVASVSQPASINYATANASGSVAGVSGNLNYNSSGNISYQTYALLPATATMRVWLGLTDQTATTMSASATPAGNYAAFRYDTGAGDTTWRCVTRDGATINNQNSNVNIGTTGVKLEIIVTSGRVEFLINGVEVCGGLTTNLPSANTMLRISNTITNLANGIDNLRLGWVYVEYEP